MKDELKIKKIHPGYLLAYIALPAAAILACAAWAVLFAGNGTVAALAITAVTALALFWWRFLGQALSARREKLRLKALDDQGFVRNHTFYSGECTVAVDLVHRKLALLFRWNTFTTVVLPASRISRVWVEDGRGGAGFLEGSSRVSFLFTIDGVTIRVNTFSSNRRWRMDSDNILVGISKADVMAEVLDEARKMGS